MPRRLERILAPLDEAVGSDLTDVRLRGDRVGESERTRMSDGRRQPRPKLNAAQVSEHLGVPESWVLAEARANRIPHARLGRYVRFDLDDIEVWWEARKRGPVRRRPITETDEEDS